MGAMMLHDRLLGGAHESGEGARAILRMGVPHHQQLVGGDGVHGQQVVDRRLQRAAGVVVLQVADVLAHERLAVHDQRHGVLEVGAEREHRP